MTTFLAAALLATLDLSLPLDNRLPGAPHYIEGHTALRQGEFDRARAAFQAAAAEDGPLAPYAVVNAAYSREREGDAAGAIRAYESFVNEHPPGPWTAYARMRLAKALAAVDQHVDAAPFFGSILTMQPRLWWFDDYAKLAAENQIRSPQHATRGFDFFREVVQTTPMINTRFDAAVMLADSPQLADRLEAAMGMIKARNPEKGMELLAALGPDVADEPELLFRWKEISAYAEIAARRFDAGRTLLNEIAQEKDSTELLPDALSFTVSALLRANRRTDAVLVANELAENHPESPVVASCYWRIAWSFLSSDAVDEALDYFARVSGVNPGGPLADDSYLERAIVRWGRGDFEDALHDARFLLRRYPDSDRRTEAAFWAGRNSELLGRDDAAAHYEIARSGDIGDYMTHRAEERLVQMGVAQNGRASVEAPRGKGILRPIEVEAISIADYFGHPGETDEAIRLQFFGSHGFEESEWEVIYIAASLHDRDDVASILRIMGQSGVAYSAIQAANVAGWGRVDGVRTPDRLRVSYPLAYWPLVTRLAEVYDLDPFLILSLARKESTYRPALTSWAGAVGLMQLMPATANWLAEVERNITPAMTKDLTRPANSLALGAAYLKRMLDRSDGNLVLALASYNGGPGNVDKWRKAYGDDNMAEFVERIPYTETRNYVKGVLANYAAYLSLYERP